MKTKPFLGGVAVGVGAVARYSVSRTENPQTTVVTTVNAPIDQAFNYVAPINLTHIFRGTALISAIVDTSIKAG